MTISSAWLRICSTLATPLYLRRIPEPRLWSCRKSCKSPTPRSLHDCSNPINRSPKRATVVKLSDQKWKCSRMLQWRVITSFIRKPSPGHPQLSFGSTILKYGENAVTINAHLQGRRQLFTSTLGSVLTPPAVFLGLLVVLWVYKCCMMVIFQNKIIYMPSVPPFSRQEEIETYVNETKPVVWKHEKIQSLDGTRLALCVGTLESSSLPSIKTDQSKSSKHLHLIYFHGNAASLPPRLPMLTGVLKVICSEAAPVKCTITALSYRGFWKSSGRASQPGIEKDAAATIEYVRNIQARAGHSTRLVIWGHSVGAGVAMRAMANYLVEDQLLARQVDGIVLETPFVSIKSMLLELYPQKWLPYRYLWPFLRNWWDNAAALQEIKAKGGPRDILVLTAGKDEVVPPDHGNQLSKLASSLGFEIRYKAIPGAYHHEVMLRGEGKVALAKFLTDLLSHRKS